MNAREMARVRVRAMLAGAFGEDVVRGVERAGVGVRPLVSGERYMDVSAAIRRLGVAVDNWPMPPAGLFVVEERTVYLRDTSPMTVVHEYGHAIDCALGGGTYLSGQDGRFREAFRAATGFVTPYAASALDEYFAESVRAMTGANSPHSLWPDVSPGRLRSLDPVMFALVEEALACVRALGAAEVA